MTKNQYKNKITRLEGKIGEMQEQVIHFRNQVKLIDAEDSKKLLERYHIESEELAELIMQREKANADKSKPGRAGAARVTEEIQTKNPKAADKKPKPKKEETVAGQVEQQISMEMVQPVKRTQYAAQSQEIEHIQEAEGPQQAEITEPAEPQNKVNPLDMFR